MFYLSPKIARFPATLGLSQMDERDLIYALHRKVGNKVTFLGIKTSEQVRYLEIPSRRVKPLCFIANILRRNDRALGHWVVFLIFPYPCLVFYDSYGVNPRWYGSDFSQFINRYDNYQLYFSSRPIQGARSLVCGLYCCHFIYLVSWYSWYKALVMLKSSFNSNNPDGNDKRMLEFYASYLNAKPCSMWRGQRYAMLSFEDCQKLLKRIKNKVH